MSKRSQIEICCPECGKKGQFTMWSSMNTVINPELYSSVRDQSVFMYECPHCGSKNYVDYGFLYHQMDDHIMIHYANSDEDREEVIRLYQSADDNMIKEMRDEHGYLIRVVGSRPQLLEKLAIFDAGYDDRIIEIIKVFLVAYVKNNEKDAAAGVEEALMYTDEGKHFVQLIGSGKSMGVIEIKDSFYQDVKKDYGMRLPDIKEDCVVDAEWALRFLDNQPEG